MKNDAISRSAILEEARSVGSFAFAALHYGEILVVDVDDIKTAPALDVVVPTNEGYGTVLHVKDINEWDSRIILTEEGSKNCAVYYADAEEEPAVWEMVDREAFWIGDEEIWMETGKPTIKKMPVCSKCKTEFGTAALGYKHCPECGVKMTDAPAVQSPAGLK